MIIGICSNSFKVGKTYLATNFFVKQYGYTCINFADPLKKEMNFLFQKKDPIFKEHLYLNVDATEINPYFENCDLSYFYEEPHKSNLRKSMQYWGTDYRRKYDPQYWINRIEINDYNLDYVISDVRFENEVEFIHKLGGKCIYLHGELSTKDSHVSEQLNPNLCDITLDWKRNHLHTIHQYQILKEYLRTI